MTGTNAQADVVLEARGISRRYGHVMALRGAELTVRAGEIVGLIGDNGAGKSTLVKILSGSVAPDAGKILVAGRPVSFATPADARRAGIETAYQDLALAPHLDTIANLFLGREHRATGLRGRLGFLDSAAMRIEGRRLLEEMSVRLPSAEVPVGMLSGGQRQIVAVARALVWASRIAFLDEPTAALGVVQTEQVAQLIRRVSGRGVAIVIISHNLPELLALVDRVVVLRLGRVAAEFAAEDASTSALLGAMTGLTTEARAA